MTVVEIKASGCGDGEGCVVPKSGVGEVPRVLGVLETASGNLMVVEGCPVDKSRVPVVWAWAPPASR